MAKLYFRYGAMGSSKTANAIMVEYNYHERGQHVVGRVAPVLKKQQIFYIHISLPSMKYSCVIDSCLLGKPGRFRRPGPQT